MDIEVISATRSKGQSLFTAPAAIAVLDGETIRRSGHRSLPELLRLVPGMHVAHVDGNKWAISARGFNGRFNALQLVQMDGRTLYTPAFSGVIWSAQDAMLEDLDRVEVIRGPGASLWGANAVNGIINFVSKRAEDTQGLLVTGGAGDEARGFGSIRYGGRFGEDGYFRVYGKGGEFDDARPVGPSYTDDWRNVQGGFRADWGDAGSDSFTVQGDVYEVRAGESIKNVDVGAGTISDVAGVHELNGFNVLGRWTRTLSDASDIELQMYYDWTEWTIPFTGPDFRQQLGQFDLDLQHRFAAEENHEIVWGMGYRRVDADYALGGVISATQTKFAANTVTGFVQDSITLVRDQLQLILGTKLENNDFTGFEYQPSGRLVWTPDEQHTVWAGVSRAVNVPSIVNDVGLITLAAAAPGVPVTLINNPNLESSEVLATEVGYRWRGNDRWSFDVSTFFNKYENFSTTVFTGPTTQQTLNNQTGEGYGVELTTQWQAADNWRLTGNYSWLNLTMHGGDEGNEGNSPEHLFSIQSYYDIADDLELNAALYYADTVPNQGVGSYARFDLGVVWRPKSNVEIGIWGQNLFDPSHPEYGPDGFLSRGTTEVERSVRASVSVRF